MFRFLFRNKQKIDLTLPNKMKVITVDEFANRAAQYVRNPQRTPLLHKLKTPKLGIFCDIPKDKFRADEAQHWARAGFDVIFCDGEHSLSDGFYGRPQYEALLRLGLTPIQRLPRDAGSQFGDALCLGARGVMRPYGTTMKDLDDFLEYTSYPNGKDRPSEKRRGAFPLKLGDGSFTADLGRDKETIVCMQFETTEYLLDTTLRHALLEKLNNYNAIPFLGDFDLRTRATTEELPLLTDAMTSFFQDAATFPNCIPAGIFGTKNNDRASVDSIKAGITAGAKLIVVPYLASELPFVGATHAAADFFAALNELGLSSSDDE